MAFTFGQYVVQDSNQKCSVIVIIKIIKPAGEKIAVDSKFVRYIAYTFFGDIKAVKSYILYFVKKCLRKQPDSAAVIQNL